MNQNKKELEQERFFVKKLLPKKKITVRELDFFVYTLLVNVAVEM